MKKIEKRRENEVRESKVSENNMLTLLKNEITPLQWNVSK